MLIARLQQWREYNPTFSSLTLLLLIALIPKCLLFYFDGRVLNGENIWLKPIKFDVSLAIFFATLTFGSKWISDSILTHVRFKQYNCFVVACVWYEVIWINGAAAFGIASHFNFDTSLMTVLYSLAGVAAFVLTSPALVYGILVAKNTQTGLTPTLHLSVWGSSVLTFGLTLLVAGYLAEQSSPIVSSLTSKASVWPLIGWSQSQGDLRVAHFFATHAFHFIPLLASLALLFRSLDNTFWVYGLCAAYTLLVGIFWYEATLGLPIFGLFSRSMNG